MVSYKKDDNIGVIEFNDADSKANLLSDRNLDELKRIVDNIAERDSHIRALFFVSRKKDIFIAGADIKELAAIKTAEEALRLCKKGQDLFNSISDLRMPKFAVVNGACVGGGLELALACDYIFATKNKKVRIGLPEVKLGIVPGFGGIHRLRERIGIEKADGLIATGRLLNAVEAKRLSIIDGIIPESKQCLFEDLLALRPRPRIVKKQPDMDQEERELLAKKILQESARNALSSYLLVSRYRHYPLPGNGSEAVHGIKRCLIVGAGNMGKGIAYLISSKTGVSVNLTDANKAVLRNAGRHIKKLYLDAVKKCILYDSEAKLKFKNITFGSASSGGVDIIIESITEDILAKKMLFAEMENSSKGMPILATNTSCIPIEELSKSLKNAERFIGIHFFNPAYKMKLVEVIPARFTSRPVLREVIGFLRCMGRIPIIVKDNPGFLVNRMALPYLNEAVFMAQDGFSREDIERAMLEFGMPMGPFQLIKEIGPEVVYKAGRILEGSFGSRMKVPDSLITGTLDSIEGFKKPGPGLVIERLLRPVKKEAEMCLDEGVVDNKDIIDLALLLGMGFPASKRIWNI